MAILSNTTGTKSQCTTGTAADDIRQLQSLVREVSISDDLARFVADAIRTTRPDTTTVDYVKEWHAGVQDHVQDRH